MKRLFIALFSSAFCCLASLLPAQVPCLIYHAHANLGYDEDLFRSHMDFFHENGYTTITADQFLDWRLNDEPLPPRPVLLTVDDNYILLYTSMYPILRERGQVFINFAISDNVGVNNGLDHCDWSELAEMEATGHVLTESHTRTHPHLTELGDAGEWSQLRGARTVFQQKMPDGQCSYIAYPYGDYDEQTIRQAIMAGYTAGFSTNPTLNDRDTPLYEIGRLSGDGQPLSRIQEIVGHDSRPPAPPGEGWTLDNGTAHFTHEAGAWNTAPHPQAYGPTAASRGASGGAHQVRWATALPEPGAYRVHAWWTADPDHATNASYTIRHGAGETAVAVNQTRNGSQWNLLGTYAFPEGVPAKVYLGDDADGIVSADAIWIEPASAEFGNSFVVY